MRGKECEDCGNINYVPKLVELMEVVGKQQLIHIRLVEVCRDCGVMIGENPFDKEQTLSWYNNHRKKSMIFRLTHDWNGYKIDKDYWTKEEKENLKQKIKKIKENEDLV